MAIRRNRRMSRPRYNESEAWTVAILACGAIAATSAAAVYAALCYLV